MIDIDLLVQHYFSIENILHLTWPNFINIHPLTAFGQIHHCAIINCL